MLGRTCIYRILAVSVIVLAAMCIAQDTDVLQKLRDLEIASQNAKRKADDTLAKLRAAQKDYNIKHQEAAVRVKEGDKLDAEANAMESTITSLKARAKKATAYIKVLLQAEVHNANRRIRIDYYRITGNPIVVENIKKAIANKDDKNQIDQLLNLCSYNSTISIPLQKLHDYYWTQEYEIRKLEESIKESEDEESTAKMAAEIAKRKQILAERDDRSHPAVLDARKQCLSDERIKYLEDGIEQAKIDTPKAEAYLKDVEKDFAFMSLDEMTEPIRQHPGLSRAFGDAVKANSGLKQAIDKQNELRERAKKLREAPEVDADYAVIQKLQEEYEGYLQEFYRIDREKSDLERQSGVTKKTTGIASSHYFSPLLLLASTVCCLIWL